jgi:hypothetical protein
MLEIEIDASRSGAGDGLTDHFDNSTRRHSHLGGVSVEQFEAVHKPHRKVLH